ncbi:MAG: polysaccharide deacetylase family protein [Caldilineales bacterium]|nr:polysaccharide deacetylase family protein [Caldilineales bacterium]
MMQAALSIDLESYWHAELLRRLVDRNSADDRVLPATLPLLDLLADRGVTATFFVVGEIIDEYPALVKRIVAEGHEIGCHGYTHRPLWSLNETTFNAELSLFTSALRRHLPGVIPRGFRAPTFSLSPDTAWALAVLARHGYEYDSSVFPMRTPLYGVPGCPPRPYRPAPNMIDNDPAAPIWEWPLTAWRIGPLTLPVCGGFYLRTLPMPVIIHGMRKAMQQGPIVVYLHPWELDEETPRLPLSRRDRFITYHNIGAATRRRLEKLLEQFDFTTMTNVLALRGRDRKVRVRS